MLKKILVIIIILFVLGIILNSSFVEKMKDKKKETNFKTKYELYNGKTNDFGKEFLKLNIPSNNKMKDISVNEILGIFNNKKDAVIYFGYPSCAYCRSAVDVLISAASKTDLDKIYYLDTNEKNINYDDLLEIFIDDFIDEDGNIYSPLVLFISKGDIISYHKGTLFSQDDPFMKLDNSQREGLSEIYINGINDVINNIK